MCALASTTNMKMFLILSMVVTAAMLNMLNPATMMVMILTQAALLCVMSFLKLSNGLMAFVLFLIFIGGLMVLFIYITSLSSNEKFEINVDFVKNTILLSATTASLLLIASIFNKHLINQTTLNINMISNIFSKTMFSPSLLIMSYLLLTLVAVVKISKKTEGPLRNIMKFN